MFFFSHKLCKHNGFKNHPSLLKYLTFDFRLCSSHALEINLKKGVHVLLGDVSFQRRVGVLAHHVINGSHDLSHFLKGEKIRTTMRLGLQMTHKTPYTMRGPRSHLSVYVAVSVDVVKVKRPLELFSQGSSQQYGQTRDEVLAATRQKANSDSRWR